MKRIMILLGAVIIALSSEAQTTREINFLEGTALYETVKNYVSLGEHRTGTETDFATSEWLGKELKAEGYDVKYSEFSLKQFFYKSASVTDSKKNTYDAFPLWYVSDSIKLDIEGVLVSSAIQSTDVRNK